MSPKSASPGLATAKPLWWQDAVIYQIYPRSFQDHDGDGVGDLRGVIDRVDYLAWLGVGAVWLSPFYVSPMADFGYDVADYTDVDPLFGTLADFDELVAALHRRDIRVIVDFVPNHSSDRHPWFLELRSSRNSRKRDWYIWRDPAPDGGPPNNWQSLAGGGAWQFDALTGQYYYHCFLKEQPDLNWHNPKVRKAMHEVLRFWMRRGADGFRLDAIGCIAKDSRFRDDPPNPNYREGQPSFFRNRMYFSADRPHLYRLLAGIRRVVDAEPGDHVLIGEVSARVEKVAAFYGDRLDRLQQPANFTLLWTPWQPKALLELIKSYEAALPPGAWPNWVIGNHDQPRIASRVGKAQARVVMMLLLTLRGTPTLYYGDELGLENVPIPESEAKDLFGLNMPGQKQGRDPERCPMPWDRSRHAGFSSGKPWLPQGENWKEISVAAQREDKTSMLALTHRLLALRRREPALSHGGWFEVSVDAEVLAYGRVHEGRRFVIVLNLDNTPKSVTFAEPLLGRVLVSTHAAAPNLERFGLTRQGLELAGDEGVVIAVQMDEVQGAD